MVNMFLADCGAKNGRDFTSFDIKESLPRLALSEKTYPSDRDTRILKTEIDKVGNFGFTATHNRISATLINFYGSVRLGYGRATENDVVKIAGHLPWASGCNIHESPFPIILVGSLISCSETPNR